MTQNRLSYLILIVLIFTFFQHCKYFTSQTKEADNSLKKIYAIVTFIQGNAVVSKSEKIKVKVIPGIQINRGDRIVTENDSKVDVQINEGILIRIAENTEVNFTQLDSDEARAKQITLEMQKGKIFSSVKNIAKNSNYTILTPVTSAAVRGTEFIIEYNGNATLVKVFNGTVIVKDRFPNLENLSDADKTKPEIIKFQNKLNEKSVSVNADQLINKKATIQLELKDFSKVEFIEKKLKDLDKISDKTENEAPGHVDEIEMKTILKLESQEIQKIASFIDTIYSTKPANEISKSKKDLESYFTEIDKNSFQSHKKLKDEYIDSVIKNPRKFTSYAAIKKHYSSLENVELNSGVFQKGALVKREGSDVYLHTLEGIKKYSIGEIKDIHYNAQP